MSVCTTQSHKMYPERRQRHLLQPNFSRECLKLIITAQTAAQQDTKQTLISGSLVNLLCVLNAFS